MENNYNGVDINKINEFATFNYKQVKYMMKQIENSICKIEVKKDKEIIYGSGFLCNILFGETILHCIITCNHVINEYIIYKIKKFKISFENEKRPYEIKLNGFKIVYTNKENDTTIIEINSNDNLYGHNFLNIDKEIYETKSLKNIKNEIIYLLHYPINNFNSNCHISKGTIINIDENNIIFSGFSNKGSSGCPILRLYNYKVLGIHKGRNKKNNLKIGKNIKSIEKDLECYFIKRILMIKRAISPLLLIWGGIVMYGGYKDKNGPSIQSGTMLILSGLNIIDFFEYFLTD